MESGIAVTRSAGVSPALNCATAHKKLRPLLVLLMALFFGVPAAAQELTKADAADSLLGISIGASLDEARAKLAQHGTGGGRDTRDGGRKEAWTLKETDFATLAFKTDGRGKVVWISAFVRPGKEISFTRLGDMTKASNVTKSQAIWSVATPEGGYRLVAKGANGKAGVVYLLSLDFPEVR